MTVDRVVLLLGHLTDADPPVSGISGWWAVRRSESKLARALAREAVSKKLGVEVDRVRLGRTASGAPTVEEPADPQAWLSISHGRGLVGCAVAVGLPVGLDIEPEREIRRWGRVARAHLTDRERTYVSGTASPGLAVLRLLSRKEAVLKAAGIGVSVPLQSVDVLDDDVAPPGNPAVSGMWSVQTLEVAQGWSVVVAVGGSQRAVDVSWVRQPQR